MIAATAFIDKIWEQNQQESARIADLCAAPVIKPPQWRNGQIGDGTNKLNWKIRPRVRSP